jgi:hypothetical protein
MDLCFGLLVFGCLLAMVTVVGHVLWLLAEKAMRGLNSLFAPALRICPECGRAIRGHLSRCPRCAEAVLPGSPLDSLTTTSRVLQDLVDRGKLDRYLAEAVCKRLDDVRDEHRNPSLTARIERLLTARQTFESFTTVEVDQLRGWFEILDNEAGSFTPALLWKSAQFHKWLNQPRAALAYYRRLFREHPKDVFIKSAALEAARFALHQRQFEDVRTFLDIALHCDLSPQEAKHAAAIRHEIDAPAGADIEPVASLTMESPAEVAARNRGGMPGRA